eukprot:m.52921 g.52921  ORF g.52921 m.52921 type:complete len:681 (-) comp10828_c1_seq4:67-2109(-)
MLLSTISRRLIAKATRTPTCLRVRSIRCIGSYRRTREDYEELVAEATTTVATKSQQNYWLDFARENLVWSELPTKELDNEDPPFSKWFPDGKLNLCENAVDRQVENGRGDQIAISYYSSVGGTSRDISYQELLEQVSYLGGALQSLGVDEGDRVLIYLPMIPEAAVAMLACTRIGAIHSVVFGGFAPYELSLRINDAKPTAIITATCGFEGAKGAIPYMPLVEDALGMATCEVPKVVIVDRAKTDPKASAISHSPVTDRDVDYHTAIEQKLPSSCVPRKSSDGLYTIYTSGTTGDPKGILRDHSHVVTLKWSMDAFMDTSPGETYFAASDIGWVVGHSYIVYAPLLHGCTSVLFEGKPVGTPDAATYWRIIEKYKVNNMFTAPTALRAIRKEDPNGDLMRDYDLSSLRTMFIAGERGDPSTVSHFQDLLGIPVVDNWWQTESGSPMCGMQLEGVGTVPGSCGLPLPGYNMQVLDPETGEECEAGKTGSIAIKLPLPPGFMATLFNNDDRFVEAYMREFPGFYSAGDAGFKDEMGYLHIMSRTDDIINVAGHRLSSGALEEACLIHEQVVECAVVGVQDDLKGTVPMALVVVSQKDLDQDEVAAQVIANVRTRVGPFAAMRACAVVPALPKTRSGKILRNVIRAIADDEPYKLPGTIEDASVLEAVTAAIESLGYGEARNN